MVTARMLATKKRRGSCILEQEGLSASQAVNLMYDRMIEEGGAGFLLPDEPAPNTGSRWAAAASFVDSLSSQGSTRFDDMSKAEIRLDRLRAKGLL